MTNLLDEIKYDLRFLKSHTLQPKWWKVAKVFVLLGMTVGHWALFGAGKTALFVALFFLSMGAVHLVYRAKTHKYTQSWLDFRVSTEGGEAKATSIGGFYYAAVVGNAILSLAIAHMLL